MKNSKTRKGKQAAPIVIAAQPRTDPWIWIYAVSAIIALFAAFEVYWPAIHGPFLLDDTHLTYMLPNAADIPLRGWIHQLRPLLMFTFWLNYEQAGAESTFGYHAFNVLLHFLNTIFVFLAIRKVLSWFPEEEWRTRILAFFAAGLFLLHPVQTESVSYVASRSETLSVFFVLAALVVFLYRNASAVSIPRILALLALFAAAALSKEHTAVLPALFILTDYYWNFEFSPSVIWRNWKLYLPIAAGAGFAVLYILRILRGNQTAGFQMQGLSWYQYFFTECRVIWRYLGLFLFPIGQNLDPDIAISKNITDHGAIVGLAGLLAVSIVAWIYRRRFPLASYGWFVFLILLAPTSSFAPIRDPMAERRLYLPFIGLLFIAVEFLRRWKASRNTFIGVLALVLVLEGAVTYQRNLLWGSAIDIWKDTVSKSPEKLRPRFQLAFAEFQTGACADSVDQFQKASTLEPPTYDLFLDWALAYDCAGNSQQAIAKLRQAANEQPSAHVYSQIGMEYGKTGKYAEALDALSTAQRLDPGFAITYYYLGNLHAIQGNRAQAREDYQRALTLDPHNTPASEALARMGR
ncbi:MAG TPA: tetratricopeptide repeat protein [Bryobacteraceae bacterium]|nr:tetratricopeptide repeat protein [Bryobacteraceae bacterium]